MIQRYKLTEADFRGERFEDHPNDLKGNNDLLVLTRPDVISEIHRAVPRGRRRHHRDQHVQRQRDRAGRLRPRVARLRAERRAARGSRAPPPTSGRRRRRTGRASSPARSGRPTARCRSRPTSTTRRSARITFDELRAAYDEQVRGLIDGGVDLLLLETIFDTLNAKAGDRRDREGLRRRRASACR